MAYAFDFAAQRIRITSPQTVVTIQDLLNEIRIAEASQLGISYPKIADASGKQTLGPGVQVGITLALLDNWQLEFWSGNYTATINGGNIVADSGDAVAFVPGGPQVEITLSAAATIVNSGAIDDAAIADRFLGRSLAGGADGGRTVRDALRVQRNRVQVSGNTLTVYAEDDTTVAWTATIATSPRDAIQQVDPA